MKKETGPKETAGKVWVSRTVTRKNKDGSTTVLEDKGGENQLEVNRFQVEPALVRTGLGLTINLGNFESARCDAGVTLPCYVEEIEEAFVKAWRITEEELQKQVSEVNRGR